ncbi:protein ILRUN-like isoform X1 [Cherax quadricarinatus]|uniref:protein ILRUN-like isoform X1 n=1 Tax=Cherax quadricarinatus TaxID=27406 RepID=UPI00387E311A
MEVDEDLEGGLLRQFNCMLTTDKEVLIKELQTLVGAHLNEHSARFYLEMTDWNLQAAVCAYFDLQSFNKLPQMTFVKDITIGEGESVPPSTRFIKTWRIQNTGEDGWPSGCSLIFTGGEQLGAPSHISVSSLGAGEVADISVEMMSPAQTGLYSSKWRMSTAQGNFFGDTIWVIVQVDSGGTLALMQQMVNLKELGSPPAATHSTPTTFANPFAPLHLSQQQVQQHADQQQQQNHPHHMKENFQIQSQQPNESSVASHTPSCQQDPDGDADVSVFN